MTVAFRHPLCQFAVPVAARTWHCSCIDPYIGVRIIRDVGKRFFAVLRHHFWHIILTLCTNLEVLFHCESLVAFSSESRPYSDSTKVTTKALNPELSNTDMVTFTNTSRVLMTCSTPLISNLSNNNLIRFVVVFLAVNRYCKIHSRPSPTWNVCLPRH